MGDEQGTVVTSGPVTMAVDAELRRLIRQVETDSAVGRYPLGGRRSTVYAVLRTAFPDVINRETWRGFAGVDPDVSEDPEEVLRQREIRELAFSLQRREDLALIRSQEPDFRECCEECTQGLADRYRRQGFAPVLPIPELAEVPEVQAPEHVEPEVPERTCECEYCTDETCQGDCDSCDDHGCAQCNCGPDSAYGCCGYCPECGSHPGDSGDEKCNMGHCHDCEHRCDDY